MSIEWGKLGLLSATLMGCFACLITKTVDPALIIPVITGIMGYITGNGRLAQTGKEHVPAIGASEDRKERAADGS